MLAAAAKAGAGGHGASSAGIYLELGRLECEFGTAFAIGVYYELKNLKHLANVDNKRDVEQSPGLQLDGHGAASTLVLKHDLIFGEPPPEVFNGAAVRGHKEPDMMGDAAVLSYLEPDVVGDNHAAVRAAIKEPDVMGGAAVRGYSEPGVTGDAAVAAVKTLKPSYGAAFS